MMFDTLRDLIKTWKPKLYEIPGYTHYISLYDGDWYPHIRFLVKYRRGYYILDRVEGKWVWKRPSMCGSLAVENDKTPACKLKFLVITGMQWEKEAKQIKKLKWRELPIIHGIESALWHPQKGK